MIRVAIRTTSASRLSELKQMLSADPDILITDEFSSGTGNWNGNELESDLLIWEAWPGDEFEWDTLDEQPGTTRVIFLADAVTEEWITAAMRSGVKAILSKEVTTDELTVAVRAVAAGLVVLSEYEQMAETLPVRQNSFIESLTPREHEVLTALAEGLTNKAVATRFDISEHTVKFHVASILSKLGATSRTEAVTLAIRHGLLMI